MKLGVPSKGRLMEDTAAWFAARGIRLMQTEGREYAGHIEGLPGATLVLLSAADMPRALAEGQIHLGVTGTDLVRDRLPDWQESVAELVPMGFGRADLVLAVPEAWIDVQTVDDLDDTAAAFRAAHGHRLRIATKYHRLVREYLTRHGVADYALVDSQGATEGSVRNATAEAIADITSSGETLRANHLKPLTDGPILASEATLYAARRADWTGSRAPLAALCARIGCPVPGL
jgi:ATP phosphoribosyltransferase